MKVAVSYTQNKNSKQAGEEIAKEVVNKTGQPDLVILYTTEFFNQKEVLAGVKKYIGDSKLIGCCAAGIMTNKGVFTDAIGIMAIKSKRLKCTTIIEKIVSKDAREAGMKAGNKLLESNVEKGTVLLLPDGFASNIADIVRGAYHIMGSDYNYIGGGTGDNLNFFKSYQFNQDKIGSDAVAAALISGIKIKTHIGHGWLPMGDDLLISKTKGKKIIKINGEPAIKAYKNYIKEINEKNFSYYGMIHPLGLPNIEGDFIIRDPIKVYKNGTIECITEIPENSMVHIMSGDKKLLLDAAGKLAKKAIKEFKDPNFIWLFDCISRYLLLDKDYKKELNTILNTIGRNVPLLGVLTFGEIGSPDNGPPLFHNKTLVITLGK